MAVVLCVGEAFQLCHIVHIDGRAGGRSHEYALHQQACGGSQLYAFAYRPCSNLYISVVVGRSLSLRVAEVAFFQCFEDGLQIFVVVVGHARACQHRIDQRLVVAVGFHAAVIHVLVVAHGGVVIEPHALVHCRAYVDVVYAGHREVLHGAVRHGIFLNVRLFVHRRASRVGFAAHVVVAVAHVLPHHRAVDPYVRIDEVNASAVFFGIVVHYRRCQHSCYAGVNTVACCRF